jgi:threonyl-tRNA synthetase
MGAKVGKAEAQKIPYMAVIGDKEIEAGAVALRGRGRKDLGVLSRADLLAKLREEDKSGQSSD